MFDADWSVVWKAHGLNKSIVRYSDRPKWRDVDGDGLHDEINEVADALWKYARLLYGAFDYYAAHFAERDKKTGEYDLFNMTFNSYLKMVSRLKLATKELPARELETIWVQVRRHYLVYETTEYTH